MNKSPIALTVTRNGPPLQSSSGALAEVRRRIESEYSAFGAEQPRLLRLALNEAEAIAGETGLAHLFFPELAREKAESAARWLRRQTTIRATASSVAFAA